MLIDSQNLFSASAGDSPTNTGDQASANVIDTGAAQDVGIGEGAWVNIVANAAVTSAGAATVQGVLQTSSDNATWTDAVAGAAIAKANLTAGATLLKTRIPPGLKRYLRVVYRIATAALTAGTFDAYITKNEEDDQQYMPAGFSVS